MSLDRLGQFIESRLTAGRPPSCWGIVAAPSSWPCCVGEQLTEMLSKARGVAPLCRVSPDSSDPKRLLHWNAHGIVMGHFSMGEIKEKFKTWANAGSENSTVPVLLTNADLLSPKELCRFVSTFRAWREGHVSNSSDAFLIISGAWSPLALQSEWTTALRGNWSPTPDRQNVLRLTYRLMSETRAYLEQRYGSAGENELAEASAVLHELTGGDCELTDLMLGSHVPKSMPTIAEVEEYSQDFADVATDTVRARCRDLEPEQVRILEQLCRFQCAVRRKDDRHADMLEIRGLVRFVDIGLKREIVLEFPSSAVGVVLRRTGVFGNFKPVTAGNQLVGMTSAANEVAYSLVLRIENLLRDCIPLLLASSCADSEAGFDMSILTVSEKRTFLEKTVVIRNGTSESPREKWVDKSTEIRLTDLVTRRREDPEKAARLSFEPPAMSYLTASELVDTLFFGNGLWKRTFGAVFGDKGDFERRMRDFRDIRNAVAHNRAISSAWVAELKGMHRWLLEKLGRYCPADSEG